MPRRSIRLAQAALALLAAPAAAEVRSADDAGFDVGASETVAAEPDAVWSALVAPSRWWDSEHTWSGKASNLSLSPRGGGCFCERLARGGSVEHMRVIRAEPGRMLVMIGALGPLQSEPVNAVLTVTLEAKGTGTTLTWRYAASGLRGMKGDAIAEPVNAVMTAQFASLVRTAASRSEVAPRRR